MSGSAGSRTVRSAAGISAALLVLVAAGCGSGHPKSLTTSPRSTLISVTAAATALRQTGFPTWIRRHTEVDERIGEIDNVEVTRSGNALDWSQAELIRFSSRAAARRAFEYGYSPGALRKQERYWRRYPRTAKTGDRSCGVGCIVGGVSRPRDFAAQKVLAYRICNVVLRSYNANSNPELTARVRHAARLLQATCRESRHT